jgi:uncharacterized protein YjfI (DUF2170 family)
MKEIRHEAVLYLKMKNYGKLRVSLGATVLSLKLI